MFDTIRLLSSFPLRIENARKTLGKRYTVNRAFVVRLFLLSRPCVLIFFFQECVFPESLFQIDLRNDSYALKGH